MHCTLVHRGVETVISIGEGIIRWYWERNACGSELDTGAMLGGSSVEVFPPGVVGELILPDLEQEFEIATVGFCDWNTENELAFLSKHTQSTWSMEHT